MNFLEKTLRLWNVRLEPIALMKPGQLNDTCTPCPATIAQVQCVHRRGYRPQHVVHARHDRRQYP